MDYEVISNGKPYEFYPLFWNADYEHAFGVYYYDGVGEQPKKVEFYTDKMEGDDCYLQYKNSQGEWTDVTTDYAYEGQSMVSKLSIALVIAPNRLDK